MRVDALIAELAKLPPHEDVRVYEDGVGDFVPVGEVCLEARGNAAYVALHAGDPDAM